MDINNTLITEIEQKLIDDLLKVWNDKLSLNKTRQEYYDGKTPLKNLNISLPNNLSSLSRSASGWGAKAVNALAARSRFDGFVYKGVAEDPLNDILRENNFYDMYRQATISELTQACAFVTVGAGMEGEPAVILNAYPATQASAKWNSRKKCIEAGLIITKWAEAGIMVMPTAFVLYTDNAIFDCEDSQGGWKVKKIEHRFGRPLMEALAYNPSLAQPFGTSRLSKAAMSIIDRAIRTIVRMDIGAEFFTIPQKYIVGADKDVLEGNDKWVTYIDHILGISRDEAGEMPRVGQFPQGQLTPLTEQLRALAAEFAGETCIPISSLGIIHDNPASAEGIHAAKEDLIMEAENLNVTNGGALKNIGLIALALLGGYETINDLPDEWKSITPKFKTPARPSTVSQSDAMVKQAAAIPWIAETTVALEELGYSNEQIMRMKAERTGASAATTFLELAGQLTGES